MGVVIALPTGGGDELVLGPADTVQVASAAAVPLAALTRVVVAGPPSVTQQIVALGYPEVTNANALVSTPAVYYHDGFREAASQVAQALGLSTPIEPLTAVVTDGDELGDVVVVAP